MKRPENIVREETGAPETKSREVRSLAFSVPFERGPETDAVAASLAGLYGMRMDPPFSRVSKDVSRRFADQQLSILFA